MEVVHARCVGLDISKRDAKVCVKFAGAGRCKTVEMVTTWESMTSQILGLRDHLIADLMPLAALWTVDGGTQPCDPAMFTDQ